jgi:FKBP-type peptidyl-prolyl cis-trans isomerase (trigger factor)
MGKKLIYTPKELEEIGKKTIEMRRKYTAKRLVKVRLILEKAKKVKIEVSNEEVEKEMKRLEGLKK